MSRILEDYGKQLSFPARADLAENSRKTLDRIVASISGGEQPCDYCDHIEQMTGIRHCPVHQAAPGTRTSTIPWWKGGQTFDEAPPEAAMNALAISSRTPWLEDRSEGIWRLHLGDMWADFICARVTGGELVARYIAGNVNPPDVAKFERYAALAAAPCSPIETRRMRPAAGKSAQFSECAGSQANDGKNGEGAGQ